MNFDLTQMKSMLEQVQHRVEEMQTKLASMTVEGSAGAGLVTVTMNGKKQVLELRLDPATVKDDPDMLPDLIRAAVNQAVAQVDQRLQSELGGASGLPLDGLF